MINKRHKTLSLLTKCNGNQTNSNLMSHYVIILLSFRELATLENCCIWLNMGDPKVWPLVTSQWVSDSYYTRLGYIKQHGSTMNRTFHHDNGFLLSKYFLNIFISSYGCIHNKKIITCSFDQLFLEYSWLEEKKIY
jgi:hypothetical protein